MANKTPIWEQYSKQIKNYCEQNNLSYEKLMKMAKQYGKDFVFFCYLDKKASQNKKNQYINDEELLPLVLGVYFEESSKVTFKQTEYTQKYIAA